MKSTFWLPSVQRIAPLGEHAVVDHQFGTTDVLIVMPVSALNPRYVSYYGADASRHAS